MVAKIPHQLDTFHGHSLLPGLLPECPMVLDVGAREFAFSSAVAEIRPKASFVCLEPDPTVTGLPWHTFLNVALVHDARESSGYASYSTGEGNFLSDDPVWYATMLRVPCINIVALMEKLGVRHWDLIKLDCEGSEFEILENWPGPIATQISVEFHDCKDNRKWGDAYFANLWQKLPDYAVVQHALTPIGPDSYMGHWDSLLVLKTCA